MSGKECGEGKTAHSVDAKEKLKKPTLRFLLLALSLLSVTFCDLLRGNKAF